MVVMIELIILVSLVLSGAVAFIDTGAGDRAAGRLGTQINTIIARCSATVDDMNYAARRQVELLTELDAHHREAANR